jgi:hypothetical protein
VIDAVGEAQRALLVRFAAPEARAGFEALFTIEREVLRSAARHLDHSVAHARLEFWADELRLTANGSPRHPATRTLLAQSLNFGHSPPDLQALCEVAELALARAAYTRREELDEPLAAWTRALFRSLVLFELACAARTEGCDPHALRGPAEAFATRAGPVVRELELLARVISHAHDGNVYVVLADPGESHELWQRAPLAEHCRRVLEDRVTELRAQLRAVAAAADSGLRTAIGSAYAWCALADQRARHTLDASPREYVDARFDPLRRTIAAWRAAVACRRGRIPAALMEPA